MRLLVCQLVLCAGVARAAQGGAQLQRYFGEESLAVPARGLERPPAGQGVAALGHDASLAQLEASAALDETPVVVDVHVSVEAVGATGSEHAGAAARPGPRGAAGPALHLAPAERAAERQRSERPASGQGLPTGSTDEAGLARPQATTVERSSSSDHQAEGGAGACQDVRSAEICSKGHEGWHKMGMPASLICAPGSDACTDCCGTCAEHGVDCARPERPAGQHAQCEADIPNAQCAVNEVMSFAKLAKLPGPDLGFDATCESMGAAEMPASWSGCGLCCRTCAHLGADCTQISPMPLDAFHATATELEVAHRKREREREAQEQQAHVAAARASGKLAPCAVLGQLPEPINAWRSPLDEQCDPEKSLFFGTDRQLNGYVLPQHGRALQWQDLGEALERLESHCAQALPSFRLLADPLLRMGGVGLTFAQLAEGVSPADEIGLRAVYLGAQDGEVVPAGALAQLQPEEECLIADLLEVMGKAMTETPDSRCNKWPPPCDTSTDARQRVVAALELLQDGPAGARTDTFSKAAELLAQAGGARGSTLLPPPQKGCKTDRECFDSRFVDASVLTADTLKQDGWTQYQHAFDKVVLANYSEFGLPKLPDVRVQDFAAALAKPDGAVILDYGLEVLRDAAEFAKGEKEKTKTLFGKPIEDVTQEEELSGWAVLRLHGGALVEI